MFKVSVGGKMQAARHYRQSPIHVLVGDNSRIHSHLLAEALKRDHRLFIVGSACNSQEFFETAALLTREVVITSAQSDDAPLAGMTRIRKFNKIRPTMPALVAT